MKAKESCRLKTTNKMNKVDGCDYHYWLIDQQHAATSMLVKLQFISLYLRYNINLWVGHTCVQSDI